MISRTKCVLFGVEWMQILLHTHTHSETCLLANRDAKKCSKHNSLQTVWISASVQIKLQCFCTEQQGRFPPTAERPWWADDRTHQANISPTGFLTYASIDTVSFHSFVRPCVNKQTLKGMIISSLSARMRATEHQEARIFLTQILRVKG